MAFGGTVREISGQTLLKKMAKNCEIEGKNFVITGGASGLGAAYAERFLQHGAQKVAILDIAEELGQEFVKKLNETYTDKAIFIKCDVSKEEEIQNSVDKVINTFKRIDVIINNAGIMNDSPNVWRKAADVNYQGLVSFTMKGVEHMRVDEGGLGGTIVNISSGAAVAKFSILPMYSGAKAAVLHFARSLTTPEFNNQTGVRILTMALGATNTPLVAGLESKTFDEAITKSMLPYLQLMEQSVDSAVAAVVKMFREGKPGSVWTSAHNRPGQDITAIVDAAFEQMEIFYLPDGFTGSINDFMYSNKDTKDQN